MDLLVTAASMTAVSLLEALSIARALADSPCSRPDPAKELLGEIVHASEHDTAESINK